MAELDSLQRELPFAYGGPKASGVIRSSPDDFFVDEDLGFEPDGQGHHVLLHVEKRDTNTQWLANQIARYAQVPSKEVGYAGLKDRHARTRQWFSVHLAGRDIDWTGFDSAQWQILSIARHQRKLRPGFLKGNRFRLVVRELAGDWEALELQLSGIRANGVPNYFGEQRFGHGNLSRAVAWLSGEARVTKHYEKSILLSSLRSALFNQVLAERLKENIWCRAIPGDVMMLAGSHSVFAAPVVDEEIHRRVAEHDISPTGPLFGRGRCIVAQQAAALEGKIFAQYPQICEFLAKAGVALQRRQFVMMMDQLSWSIDGGERTLTLEFALTAGCYATSLLREILRYSAKGVESEEMI